MFRPENFTVCGKKHQMKCKESKEFNSSVFVDHVNIFVEVHIVNEKNIKMVYTEIT